MPTTGFEPLPDDATTSAAPPTAPTGTLTEAATLSGTTAPASAASAATPSPVASPLDKANELISKLGEPGNAPQAYQPDAPAAREVGPDQTVSGNINTLLKENGTYLQQARADALKQMNARGVANSSMAIGASQDAAIRASLPIAQQDASTKAQASRDAELFGQQTALEQQRYDFQANLSQLDHAEQQVLLDIQNKYSRGLLELGSQLGQDDAALADFFKQEQAVLGTSLNLQEHYGQGVEDLVAQTTKLINGVYTTEGLTAEQQTAAVNTLNAQLESDLELLKATYESMPAWVSVWKIDDAA
jgi:hypothetical protein